MSRELKGDSLCQDWGKQGSIGGPEVQTDCFPGLGAVHCHIPQASSSRGHTLCSPHHDTERWPLLSVAGFGSICILIPWLKVPLTALDCCLSFGTELLQHCWLSGFACYLRGRVTLQLSASSQMCCSSNHPFSEYWEDDKAVLKLCGGKELPSRVGRYIGWGLSRQIDPLLRFLQIEVMGEE